MARSPEGRGTTPRLGLSLLDVARLPPSAVAADPDLNALFSVGWAPWQTSPDTSDWAPVLERSLTWVAAFDGEQLVGFVNVAWDGRDHAFVLDTRVHPDHRHQGVGTELVRRAARAAADAGCTVLHVDYEDSLHPFYEACGFRPTLAGILSLSPQGVSVP
ncbi:MAG: GNAT family N-acetyltransferase [Myxococcota bacterium]